MSDVQMTAEAPVDLPNPIAIDNVDPNPPDPEKVEAKVKEPVVAPKPTMRETLEKAAAKIEKDNPTEKPVETQAQRDEKGKFAAKPDASKPETLKAEPVKGAEVVEKASPTAAEKGQPGASANPADAPARFSPDAKAAWATAPDAVKAEVHRAVRELESGITQHKERWAPLAEYDELAKKSGTTIDRALKEYVGIDKMLGENFAAGIERICANKGVNLREFAAQILGQAPDQVQAQSETKIRQLERVVQQLQEQVGGVTGTLQTQAEKDINNQIAAFAQDKPLFSELSAEIASHIANDGLSLEDAYDTAVTNAKAKAARLGFIPQAPAADPIVPDRAAQTHKGQLSIAGAPSAGSTPATQQPSSSIRDALRRATQVHAG